MRKEASLAVAMLFLVVSAQAAVVITTLQAPFTDTVVVGNQTKSEVVSLLGQIYLVAQVAAPTNACQRTDPCRSVPITVVSLGVASGAGQTTGKKYVAVGISRFQGTFTMPGAFVWKVGLRLLPNDPIVPPNPIILHAIVNVSPKGTATGASVQPSGLVSLWQGEGNAADAVGKNSGTLQETVDFLGGKAGLAFSFHGAGFVEVAASPTLQPAAVTAMAWVRNLGVPGANNYVLSQGAQACASASYALHTGQGNLKFYVADGTTFVESPDAGPGVWDGNWHLVAGTYDGAMVRLYVDGVEVAPGTSTAIAINYALPDSQEFFIGAYRGGGTCELRFQGEIDEVRIFNRALSAREIQSVFSATP